VIRHRKIIFAVFIGIAVICAMAQKFVSVNYDMNSYLPEALSYKEKLGEIDGVTDVTWLDDAVTAKIGELAANGDQEATALYQCAATENTGINDYTSAVNKITTGYASITGGAKDLADGTATLYQGTQELVKGTQSLKDGAGTLSAGTESLLNGALSLQSGAGQLADNTLTLQNGSKSLAEGAAAFKDGTKEMKEDTKELSDDTDEFQSETADLDTKISDKISDTIDDMTGKDVGTVSFVSEKNTNIESVLFVIKTPAIQKEEVKEETVTEEKKETFWEKLVGLFK
jgi:X-X-X-Leu-X-X-Gly heptad repeat protein